MNHLKKIMKTITKKTIKTKGVISWVMFTKTKIMQY